MKRGMADTLDIYMNVDYSEVDTIDFIFKDINSESADILVSKNYPNECTLDDDTCILSIPFTEEETRKFNRFIYMDTKITKNDGTIPETEVIKIIVKPTLFPDED